MMANWGISVLGDFIANNESRIINRRYYHSNRIPYIIYWVWGPFTLYHRYGCHTVVDSVKVTHVNM